MIVRILIALQINNWSSIKQKDYRVLLSLYIGTAESFRFWMQLLPDLQTRSQADILIAGVAIFSNLVDAIASIYLPTDAQLCIVH